MNDSISVNETSLEQQLHVRIARGCLPLILPCTVTSRVSGINCSSKFVSRRFIRQHLGTGICRLLDTFGKPSCFNIWAAIQTTESEWYSMYLWLLYTTIYLWLPYNTVGLYLWLLCNTTYLWLFYNYIAINSRLAHKVECPTQNAPPPEKLQSGPLRVVLIV